MRRVTDLTLNDESFCDRDLRTIDDLSGLQRLCLNNTRVTDLGLQHICASQNGLRELHLCGSRISDAGLVRLTELTRLRALTIMYTQGGLSDECIASVARIENLEWLSLFGTDITDRALPFLASMRKLRYIDLRYTECSEDAVIAFGREKPGTSVLY